MRGCSFVAAGEYGRGFIGANVVSESHAHCRPSATRRAAAHGVDHHQDSPAAGRKKAVDFFRRSCFFHSVLREVGAHGRYEMFRIGHESILPSGGSRAPSISLSFLKIT